MNAVLDIPKLTVRREIRASAEELFDAWLDPEALVQFMLPGPTERTTVTVDPRVGGRFEIVMHTPGGAVSHTGSYRRIDRPRTLVFTWNSQYAGHADSLVTVEFRATRGATEIVLTHEGLPGEEMVKAHTGGWTDILAILAKRYGKEVA